MSEQNTYTPDEQGILLTTARRTLKAITSGASSTLETLIPANLPPDLNEPRAVFVTLEMRGSGELRGCTGTLAARLPLIKEVIHSTHHTAFNDPRFMPVTADEVPHIRIEISILTPSKPLEYKDAADLLQKLRPHVDGVTLSIDAKRATFLPQVWERFANPADFLDALCYKMGVPNGEWRKGKMRVETYAAIKLIESD